MGLERTKKISKSIQEHARKMRESSSNRVLDPQLDNDELLYKELDDIARMNDRVNGMDRGMVNGRGRTNGLINGVGRTNGLINGNGRTNGLVNGRGRTNGFVNGIESAGYDFIDHDPEDPRRRRPQRRRLLLLRYSAIILGLLFLFSVSISLIPEEPRKPSIITIDGRMDDWDGVSSYSEHEASSNPDIDLESYSFVVEKELLSLHMEFRGTALGDTVGFDGVYLFIDSDGLEATGYLYEGLGVDYAVEIFGSNNTVEGASIMSYGSVDQNNWSAFFSIGRVQAMASGSDLEAQIRISYFGEMTENTRFSIHTNDYEGGELDSSLQVGEVYGALEVFVRGIEENCIIAHVPQDVLMLTFAARGSAVSIDSVSVSLSEQGTLSSVASFDLPASQPVVRIVSISSLTASPGDLITISLDEVQADRPVRVRGGLLKCYYQSAPSQKLVDGWFGDWTESAETDDRNLPVDQASTDMKEYSASQEPLLNETLFYAKVHGPLFQGSSIPKKLIKMKKSEGEPSPVPPSPVQWKPRMSGEDFLRIYIDSNSSDHTGANMGAFQITPDYMIQIIGVNGRILSKSLLRWEHKWTYVSGVAAEKNDDSIEASIPSWLLTPMNNTEMLFEMTDWKSIGDRQLLLTTWQTRSGTRGVYTVETTTSSATSTAYSTQRKLFHDGTYFWSFYYDGDESATMYEYSSDGSTWSSTSVAAFSTSSVMYASVWYDSGNSVVYIVGDTSASDTTVIVRKGTISGTSISWGSEYTVTVSNSNLGSKVAFISQDTSGYLWVISSSQETDYNCAAARSTNTNDVSAWESLTVMRTGGDVPNDYVFPMIYPLSDGDMYAIWYADGNIEGRGYDASGGSWDSNEVSIASTSDGKTNRGPSAVVDSTDTIHLIYSDTSGYVRYHYKPSGSSWTDGTDPEASQTANAYPTLTVLSSNDDLYAFYIRSSQIYCKKWAGGSWSSVTLTTDTVPKVHLTSAYSASTDYRIGWEWREYDSFDEEYSIKFERIPEFQDVLPLFLGILAMGLASKRIGRMRRKR
jgi:hypothetical protein